jgi:hypothetical protein
MNHVVEISGAQCLELLPVVDHIDYEHRGGSDPSTCGCAGDP